MISISPTFKPTTGKRFAAKCGGCAKAIAKFAAQIQATAHSPMMYIIAITISCTAKKMIPTSGSTRIDRGGTYVHSRYCVVIVMNGFMENEI